MNYCHSLWRCAGSPPLGSRGTVVGVHEGALEVMFDHDFIGGNDLQGRCHGRCGTMLPPSHLLNLAKPQFINLQGLPPSPAPAGLYMLLLNS